MLVDSCTEKLVPAVDACITCLVHCRLICAIIPHLQVSAATRAASSRRVARSASLCRHPSQMRHPGLSPAGNCGPDCPVAQYLGSDCPSKSNTILSIYPLIVHRTSYPCVLSLNIDLLIYLLQRSLTYLSKVSKRWNTLLSSPVVYSTVLHIPSGDDLPVLEQRRRFIRHARRRVMLERGQPVSKSLYPSPQVPNPPARVAFDYFGGRCAWVDSGPDSRGTGIAVRCLRSGEMCRFHTENRDPVSSVRISDTIVATVTMRG